MRNLTFWANTNTAKEIQITHVVASFMMTNSDVILTTIIVSTILLKLTSWDTFGEVYIVSSEDVLRHKSIKCHLIRLKWYILDSDFPKWQLMRSVWQFQETRVYDVNRLSPNRSGPLITYTVIRLNWTLELKISKIAIFLKNKYIINIILSTVLMIIFCKIL